MVVTQTDMAVNGNYITKRSNTVRPRKTCFSITETKFPHDLLNSTFIYYYSHNSMLAM